jgi:hypothetical protein
LSSSTFQYRFNCESEIFSAFCSASSFATTSLVCFLIGTSTTSGSGSTSSPCTLSTASVSAASEIFDDAFLADASMAEGFVTRADFELKERVDCAAVFRVDADGLPLLRRPGGIVDVSKARISVSSADWMYTVVCRDRAQFEFDWRSTSSPGWDTMEEMTQPWQPLARDRESPENTLDMQPLCMSLRGGFEAAMKPGNTTASGFPPFPDFRRPPGSCVTCPTLIVKLFYRERSDATPCKRLRPQPSSCIHTCLESSPPPFSQASLQVT